MRTSSAVFILSMATLFLGVNIVHSQAQDSGVRNSISVQSGFAWALGEWTQHPYAPVTFFRQDLVIGGDLAFRLSDDLALAVNGYYSELNTGDWDEYARSRGDAVTSSASLGFITIALRSYLKNSAPDLVSIDVGPLVLLAGGSERVGSQVFNFDFLSSTRFGGFAAIEYDRLISDYFALYLRVAGAYVPSALQYADGWSPSLVTIPVTVGGRVLF